MNNKYLIYIAVAAIIAYYIYTYTKKTATTTDPEPVNNTEFPTWETNKLYSPNTTVWFGGKLYNSIVLIGQSQTNESPNKDGRWKQVDAAGMSTGETPVSTSGAAGNVTADTVSNVDWDSLINSTSNVAATIPTNVTNNTTYPTWTNKSYIAGNFVWFNGTTYRAATNIDGNNNNTPDKDGRWSKI